MILESKEKLISTMEEMDRLGISESRLIKIAALWFRGEIENAFALYTHFKEKEIEASIKAPVSRRLEFLISLGTGHYLDRWALPTTHKDLIDHSSDAEKQIFFFSNIGDLASINGFSIECREELLKILLRRRVIDTTVTVPSSYLEVTGEPKEAFRELMNYDVEYLRQLFAANHWMLLLFFAINSFRVLGYDAIVSIQLGS